MKKKIIVAALMALMVIATMAIGISAETIPLDTGISTAIQNGVTQVKADFTSLLGVVLPVALSIGGLGIAIKLGWSFFKRIGK